METVLLIILICLAIINIILLVLKKNSSGDDQKLRGVEDSITRFDAALGKNETFIKEEFFRNRTESNEQFKSNREELNKALNSFETQFAENTKKTNDFIKERFDDFSKSDGESSKLAIDKSN